MVGQVVDGKYEILRLVGEGGMGAVYEARHRTTGRSVALKVISSDDVRANETLITRFEREAQAAAKVRSPHIVEILDAGHDAATGHPYMVMELLVGMNVHRLLRDLGPLPPDLAVRIAIQTCFGLEKAHAAGVVHRDIKPANLFLSDGEGGEKVVKLLDFGVAKFKMDQASEAGLDGLTRTGSVLGSPMYMSPEQARGLKTIDHRADVWSLGIVLYQLLSGKTPHAGIDGVGELIITICSEEPTPLRKRAPWISPRLEAVVHGALKLTAGERYQSAAAMRAALLTCLPDASRWHIAKAELVGLSDSDRAARPGEGPVAIEDDGATVALDAGPDAPAMLAPLAPALGRPFGGADDASTMALEPDQLGIAASLPFGRRDPGEPPLVEVPAADGNASRWASGGPAVPAPQAPAASPAAQAPLASAGAPLPAVRSSGRGRTLAAVGVGVVVGIATVAGILTMRRSQPTEPVVVTASAATSASSAPAASAPAVDPVPVSTAAPTPTNRVRVVPPQASVSIDGKRVTPDAEGYLAVDGPVGKQLVFTVVWQGKPTVRTVRLGPMGPVPAEIFVGTLPSTGTAAPAASPSSAATAPAKPPASAHGPAHSAPTPPSTVVF